MTNDESNSNDESPNGTNHAFEHWNLIIDSTFVIRHSNFSRTRAVVIRVCSIYPESHFSRKLPRMTSTVDDGIRKQLVPGIMVKVTQQIAARNYTWTKDVVGEVVSFEQKQTGSWYAHSKDDKLWLDRLVLKKADGEITTLNLDDYTHIEITQ